MFEDWIPTYKKILRDYHWHARAKKYVPYYLSNMLFFTWISSFLAYFFFFIAKKSNYPSEFSTVPKAKDLRCKHVHQGKHAKCLRSPAINSVVYAGEDCYMSINNNYYEIWSPCHWHLHHRKHQCSCKCWEDDCHLYHSCPHSLAPYLCGNYASAKYYT